MNNIPKGFKLVPVEPTDDMIVSFAEAWYSKRQTIDDPDMTDAYRDMLAAAPTPPKPIYDEAKERELFEAWAYSVCHVPYGWLGREYFKRMGDHYEDDYAHGLWQGWKARAQSRAKAGEDES